MKYLTLVEMMKYDYDEISIKSTNSQHRSPMKIHIKFSQLKKKVLQSHWCVDPILQTSFAARIMSRNKFMRTLIRVHSWSVTASLKCKPAFSSTQGGTHRKKLKSSCQSFDIIRTKSSSDSPTSFPNASSLFTCTGGGGGKWGMHWCLNQNIPTWWRCR